MARCGLFVGLWCWVLVNLCIAVTPQTSPRKSLAVAQSRFGVPLTCLRPLINQPLKSNAIAPDQFVDAFGNNIKKL